jgi:hypothetical protein
VLFKLSELTILRFELESQVLSLNLVLLRSSSLDLEFILKPVNLLLHTFNVELHLLFTLDVATALSL